MPDQSTSNTDAHKSGRMAKYVTPKLKSKGRISKIVRGGGSGAADAANRS